MSWRVMASAGVGPIYIIMSKFSTVLYKEILELTMFPSACYMEKLGLFSSWT